MVWGFFPVDPLSGEDKFYIFAPGKYKVGRKGCDLIITKDKGVSRIHAEIVVDTMIFFNSKQSYSSDVPSKVWINDCSKYGTFVCRNSGLKDKIHELPKKEASLYDGDVVSFGSGSATYRFSFVPLLFHIHCSESFQVQLLKDKVSSIGASTCCILECTHVLVEELTPFKEVLVDAIVAEKPFVLTSWVELFAGKTFQNEIPGFDPYYPTMTVEGMRVKVVDPNTRKNCLSGYTFLLGLTHMQYKYRDQLKVLLQQVGGANVLSIEDFSPDSQDFRNGENDRVVFVVPEGSAQKFGSFCKVDSYYQVKELVLVSAVLSGKLDISNLKSPCELVSSSCSTDETVVAESDLEMETATSVKSAANVEVSNEYLNKPDVPVNNTTTGSAVCFVADFRDSNSGAGTRGDKADDSDHGSIDIIYSQDLIVRHVMKPSSTITAENSGVLDFKCFRKTNTNSGNSFHNLVPFAKYPYKDSDFGNEEVAESVKEEKKRKEKEAIAEDLFHNEKGRRRGVAGSLQGLFNRT